MRYQEDMTQEIFVDNFAGGGGASTGIEIGLGVTVAAAINHDPAAILMHKTNHPYTEHYQASVWDIDPREVCRGRPVAGAWFSPDCKHFSKAKGAALVNREIRGLAWITLRWAALVRPRVIMLENVEEFQTWGPVRKGKPVKKLAGTTFRKFISQLRDLGYAVEYRELVAADLGAPTTRKRFVLIARCDGRPIVWPERTHAPRDSEEVRSGRLKPWRSAAEIIDWSLPCPSVFESKAEILEKYGLKAVRPLADNTMRRIIRGVDKFTIRSEEPFIVPTGYGERKGPLDVTDPMHTVTSHDREAVVAAHVVKFKGDNLGSNPAEPMQTVTASAGRNRACGGGTFALCKVWLCKTGNSGLHRWPEVRALLNRYCGYTLAEDELLLLEIGGAFYYIADIGLRMLSPRELYNAMGFPPDYIIDRDYTGKPYPKNEQVARCGNAVCPPLAAAVARANFPEYVAGDTIGTMAALMDRLAV